MLSKNFQVLNSYDFLPEETQEQVFNKIKKLEEFLVNENLDDFGNNLRKILELILSSHEQFQFDGYLGEKIKQLTDAMYLPPVIFGGLKFMSNIAGRESHALTSRRDDKYYNIILQTSEAKVCLRDLGLFIKWILININDISDNQVKELDFNDDLAYSIQKDDKSFDGINTNNDILAQLFSLSTLLMDSDKQFNIPTYQRDYKWNESNIGKLIEDIDARTVDNKTHYMGSLAIATEKNSNILRIIDGQQRITTSLIMFKVFYDQFKARDIEMGELLSGFGDSKIKNIYVNKEILDVQKSINLLFKGIKSDAISKDTSKLPFQNYDFINKWLTSKDDEELKMAYATLSTKFEVTVILFDQDIDNEMDIFENLNTGGTQLNNWELIRSYIFSRVESQEFRKNEDFYNKQLQNNFIIELNKRTNNKYEAPLNVFFTIYNRFIYAVERNNVWTTRKEALKTFKEVWPIKRVKFKNPDEFLNEFNEINKIFKIYLSLKYDYTSNKSKLYPYAHILDFVSKDEIMPLLIQGALEYCEFKNGEISKVSNKFIQFIRVLESYYMRSDVYGNNQDEQFDLLLVNWNKDVYKLLFSQLKKFSVPLGTLEEFESKMSNSPMNTEAIKSIVTAIELKLRKISLGSTGYVAFEKTHEHIIAQKLKYENYDDQTIGEDEFENLLKSRKNFIGNALLLTQGDNSRAGNKKFINKLDVYKDASYMAKGSKEPFLGSLIDRETFTFDDVLTRSKEIAKFVIESKLYYDDDKNYVVKQVQKSTQDEEISRIAKTIGLTTFVKYFYDFESEDFSTRISDVEGWTLETADTKKYAALRAFKLGIQDKILDMVINSNRIKDDVIENAKKIKMTK